MVDKSVEPQEEVPVKCTSCGYEWKTKSKLRHISCPDCRYTNKKATAIANAAATDEVPCDDPDISSDETQLAGERISDAGSV